MNDNDQPIDFQEARRHNVICALLEGKTMQEAADEAGISVRTLRRWKESPQFATEYEKVRREFNERLDLRLERAAASAAETLERLLTCGNPLIEMRAARTIMQSARKSAEMAETRKQLKDAVHSGAKQTDQITKLLTANKNYAQSRQELIELKHSLRHGSFKRPDWISAYTWDNIVNHNKTSPQRT